MQIQEGFNRTSRNLEVLIKSITRALDLESRQSEPKIFRPVLPIMRNMAEIMTSLPG